MDTELLCASIRAAARATFSRAGGPGGQNVNKVNTKAALRISLKDLRGLHEAELARLRERLAGRVSLEDEIIVQADGERSRRSNLEAAFTRLEALVRAAARLPKTRRPTRPGRAAREERLASKRHRSETKATRQSSRHTRPED